MAESAVTVTVVDEMPLVGRGYLVNGTLAIGASPGTYTSGGIALGVAAFAGKTATQGAQAPKLMFISGVSGYHYEYDVVNDKLIIRQSAGSAAALAEISAGAMPAGVSGDTVRFLALFDKAA